jgi:predicted nucleic acid-binding protein
VTGWLLDTNVISELHRPRPDAKVVSFIARNPLHLMFVSAVTLAEIRFGMEIVKDPIRRMDLDEWLIHTVRPMFENRVLNVTEDIMLRWRLLVENGRKTGHTFTQPDLIIAATALHHGLTMVSRDTRDFAKANITVLNPWEST